MEYAVIHIKSGEEIAGFANPRRLFDSEKSAYNWLKSNIKDMSPDNIDEYAIEKCESENDKKIIQEAKKLGIEIYKTSANEIKFFYKLDWDGITTKIFNKRKYRHSVLKDYSIIYLYEELQLHKKYSNFINDEIEEKIEKRYEEIDKKFSNNLKNYFLEKLK